MTGKTPRDRGLHRHGLPDPSKWDEQQAVAGRPADEPPDNSTFAARAKARNQRGAPADVTAVAQTTSTAPRAKRRPKKG